jgi:tRNA pseudouridine32 synthase/23S rRNA pseudouridine746 synthase
VERSALIHLLLETDELIALDKAEGMTSVPAHLAGESLLEQARHRWGPGLLVVHRLDKEVSGVIVFAKTPAAHRRLNAAFASRQVEKHYLGVVHGHPGEVSGVINRPIRAFGSGRMGVHPSGKPSLTEYEVLETVGAFTLLGLRPQSGRRHQIRAHLFSIGHPLVGDRRYGDPSVQRSFARLMLHAHRLRIPALDGVWTDLTSPVPATFLRVLQELREYPAGGPVTSGRGRQEERP